MTLCEDETRPRNSSKAALESYGDNKMLFIEMLVLSKEVTVRSMTVSEVAPVIRFCSFCCVNSPSRSISLSRHAAGDLSPSRVTLVYVWETHKQPLFIHRLVNLKG